MGVHTLLLLAHSEGESLTSATISRSTNTNPVVVRRLLCSLSKAGLVLTQKGPRGGAKLSRPAEDISMAEIYRAVETTEPLNRPRAVPNPRCPVGARMETVLNRVFASAQTALERELDLTSLADFVVAYQSSEVPSAPPAKPRRKLAAA